MKAKTTFILFWIDNFRAKENLAELFARITVNGKRVNLSLKEKVLSNFYNNRTSKVKGSSLQVKQIDQYLEVIRI
jgi:hypothetical protein